MSELELEIAEQIYLVQDMKKCYEDGYRKGFTNGKLKMIETWRISLERESRELLQLLSAMEVIE